MGVVVDGQAGAEYDESSHPRSSAPDGKRVAYVARKGREVVGGGWMAQAGAEYDGIGKGTLIFTPTASRVAYGSPRRGSRRLVVVDGQGAPSTTAPLLAP